VSKTLEKTIRAKAGPAPSFMPARTPLREYEAGFISGRDLYNANSRPLVSQPPLVPAGSAQMYRDIEPSEEKGTPATPAPAPVPAPSPKTRPHPTGIEKTRVIKQKLHFGARYGHKFTSSGGSLEGIHVTEKVTKVQDDFKTGLPNIERGKHKAPIDKDGEIADKIWISFGAIAPAVRKLREKKKPGESLLGKELNKQELYYWDNGEPRGWKWFKNVEIEQRLYDMPGLVVATIDNGLLADAEEFTPFPPAKEEETTPER
jgi:hypothetical protein